MGRDMVESQQLIEKKMNDCEREEYLPKRCPESRRWVEVRYKRRWGMGPGGAPRTPECIRMHGWPVDSAGDSTVIGELGIQAVGPTPGRAAYLLSETGKPSAPRVF